MLLCACACGVKSEISLDAGDSASKAVVKRSVFINSVVQNVCVCILWNSCLRAKMHLYYMWPFAKKLYHGCISTMTSSNEISWKLPPTEMKSWLRPWITQHQLRQLILDITSYSNNCIHWCFKTYWTSNINLINHNTSCDDNTIKYVVLR